ncbi:hypothetical protein AC579_9511 [Pseudocercospora musae]|uniref:Uncharacterized protein n=1 Tax=Pseudocercospora musae TaxID=113226 RepID=A0A139IMV2_9PEZI|nr:hypothetical protein AC579_9511 [Pseudocercospora musae]
MLTVISRYLRPARECINTFSPYCRCSLQQSRPATTLTCGRWWTAEEDEQLLRRYRAPYPESQSGRYRQPFSTEEDEIIIERRRNGLSARKTAMESDRSTRSIQHRLRTLRTMNKKLGTMNAAPSAPENRPFTEQDVQDMKSLLSQGTSPAQEKTSRAMSYGAIDPVQNNGLVRAGRGESASRIAINGRPLRTSTCYISGNTRLNVEGDIFAHGQFHPVLRWPFPLPSPSNAFSIGPQGQGL